MIKFVPPSRAAEVLLMTTVGFSANVAAVTRLPDTVRLSGVAVGRPKGRAHRIAIVTTETEVLIVTAQGEIEWRAELAGASVAGSGIDSIHIRSSTGDSFKVVIGALYRGRPLAHLQTACALAVSAATDGASNRLNMTVITAQGLDVKPGTPVEVLLGHHSVEITEPRTQRVVASAAGGDLLEFVVAGPGLVQEGGGFVGGGFGVKGAAQGMVAASILNDLTTTSRIQTSVRVGAKNWSLVLFSGDVMPDDLRVSAPQVASVSRAASPLGTPSTADQLKDLAGLYTEGLLSAEEFSAAKHQLLHGSGPVV